MSFSVHNAHLHMTNANTVEDKRITPPSPVIVIRWWRGSDARVRLCVEARVQTVARVNPPHPLIFFGEHLAHVLRQEQRVQLVRGGPSVPAWSTHSEAPVFLRWSGTRPGAFRGPDCASTSPPGSKPFTSRQLCESTSLRRRHTFLASPIRSPPRLLPVQYSVITRPTKGSREPGRLGW